ncbi:MAG TPA: ABC transporter permease [Pseudomonadota bacterium]|nr:ABC transporter permease [Pseudomonadota bacterium]
MNSTPQAVPFLERRFRPLPEDFTHRTSRGVSHGPLSREGASDAIQGHPEPISAPDEPAALVSRQSLFQVLWVLVRTEFRARYRAQALGIVWSLLNPLVMMGMISVIFTQLFRQTEQYFPIFLLIGLLVWQWFSTSLNSATSVFVSNADIIKRTVFARPLLPLASVLSHGVNFLIECVVLLAFVPIFPGAFRLSPALLLVPVFLLIAVALMSGIVLATSVLNVVYRDVAYLVSTALLLLYWATPVFYPIEVIPFPFRTILQCNPLAGIMTALRLALMRGEVPTLLGWMGMLLPTGVAVLLGFWVFRHYETMVLDYV